MEAERRERLGTKWVCYSCETRFYDLKKPDPLCPKCQADQRESPVFDKKTTRARATKKKAARKKARKKSTTKKARASLAALDDEQTTAPVDEDKALPVDKIDPTEAVSELSGDD